MKKAISLLLVFIMLLSSSAMTLCAEDFSYTSVANAQEWELLNAINEYRAKNGKSAVSMTVSLQDASGVRSKELLFGLSHYRPDGSHWYSVLEANAVEYNTESFEIIAANFADAKSLISALDSQAVNKERLLGDYSHIGLGYSSSADTQNSSAYCIIGITCNEEGTLSLCNTDNIHLTYGESKENIDIVLKKNCSHGNSYLKVMPKMIEGHDPAKMGTSTLRVVCGSQILNFDIINDYTDSKQGSWYYEAVLNCTDKGYFSGTGKGKFVVRGEMTREMFVTVLGRFAKVDTTKYQGSSFSDVKTGQWYSPYVEWASKNEIVNGDGKGKFNGSKAITRQEICVILFNYMKKYNIELNRINASTEFADQLSISSWALEAVDYCQTRGILSGDTKGNMSPRNKATRAEVAVIFNNLDKLSYEY